MKPVSLRDIAWVTGASGEPADVYIDHVCTDTRKLTKGCLFLALRGDKFDGHDYIDKALEQGAVAAIAMTNHVDGRVLRVQDTRAALMAIANHYRRTLGLKVVGITGSVGKTTTKEMVACVLQSALHTLKTPANLNNEVGLSQTILMLDETHEAAVLEMGTDGPGQMEPLARCAEPDIGVVTGIGVSHIEQMGSREGIRDEKLQLRAGMADGKTLLLCADNDLLCDVRDERLNVVFYGIDHPGCAVRAVELHERDGGTAFKIRHDGGEYPAFVPALGRHNVQNALAAFAAGVELGIEPARAAKALEDYAPEGMRQKMVKHHGFTVVEDCYNASPDSMRAALQTLGGMPCAGRRIAVLSDMLELGHIEAQAHREVGQAVAEAGADILLCTGERAKLYAEGAAEKGLRDARHFSTQEALFEALKGTVGEGDIVWFKASRGMHLENILERVYNEI